MTNLKESTLLHQKCRPIIFQNCFLHDICLACPGCESDPTASPDKTERCFFAFFFVFVFFLSFLLTFYPCKALSSVRRYYTVQPTNERRRQIEKSEWKRENEKRRRRREREREREREKLVQERDPQRGLNFRDNFLLKGNCNEKEKYNVCFGISLAKYKRVPANRDKEGTQN